MSYEVLNVRITGAAPLLCHNAQLANPANEFARAIKEVSSKRKKVDADYEEMSRIEFLGGLYLMNGEPCIPGEMLEATIIRGAMKSKQGPAAKAGMFCGSNFALHYDGPRKPDELAEDKRFRLVCGVVVNKSRVMRTRPIFRDWSLDAAVSYMPGLVNKADLLSWLRVAGEQLGIGTWRPRFGRFAVEEIAA